MVLVACKLGLSMGKNKMVRMFGFRVFLFAFLYGVVFVNWLDFCAGSWGFHFWLTCFQFLPFVPLLLISIKQHWKTFIISQLLASLGNDLFAGPVWLLMFGWRVDLFDWYKWQFGFYGFDVKWTHDMGFWSFPVSSLLMAVSIWLRVTIILLLSLRFNSIQA